MSIEYYSKVFLWRLDLRIGTPVKIDGTMLGAMRGKYAMLCVEVDLNKPLLSKFRFWRKIRRLEYEGLHLICFNCGCYDHHKDSCSALAKEV